MKKEKGYAPMQYIERSLQPGREFEERKNQLIAGGAIEDIDEESYVQFFLSDDFLEPTYRGPYQKINQLFLINMDSLEKHIGIPLKDFAKHHINPQTEWKDLYLAPVLLDHWRKNKQVYKPDSDFADALFRTKKLEIARENVKRLPCREFYIDLSDCKEFGEASGIFLFVKEHGNVLYITEYVLMGDQYVFSYYGGGEYDEKGIMRADFETFQSLGYEVYEQGMKTRLYGSEEDRLDVTVFGLQLLNYLTVRKPDIQENPVTKKTYRPLKPGQEPKDRFSEVHMQDVGIRYGTTVRTMLAAELKEYQEKEQGKDPTLDPEQESCPGKEVYLKGNKGCPQENDLPGSKKTRKTPVPHFRRAHWQTYWTGAGRTERELRWIEPVFVGFGNNAKDVVIHRVSGD